MRVLPWLLIAVGVLLLGAWLPGAEMATGPRIGMGMLAVTVGGLMVTVPAIDVLLRRRARPGDYQSQCPVGQSCPACGAFNLRPRQVCRMCAGPVNAP